jgi:hypothetical protein
MSGEAFGPQATVARRRSAAIAAHHERFLLGFIADDSFESTD